MDEEEPAKNDVKSEGSSSFEERKVFTKEEMDRDMLEEDDEGGGEMQRPICVEIVPVVSLDGCEVFVKEEVMEEETENSVAVEPVPDVSPDPVDPLSR